MSWTLVQAGHSALKKELALNQRSESIREVNLLAKVIRARMLVSTLEKHATTWKRKEGMLTYL